MRKRRTMKKAFRITLAVLLAIGAVFACVSIFGKDTKTVSSFDFTVGGIGENGEYVKNNQSIYTKDMFECYGLTVEPNFEFDGVYKIFFYNMDREFLSSTEELSTIYNEKLPLDVRYARVMITPAIPEDEDAIAFEIGYLEKLAFANDVTISVDKDQKLNNLVNEGQKNKTYTLENDTLDIKDEKGKAISSDIAVNVDEVTVYRIVNDTNDTVTVYFRSGTAAEVLTVNAGDEVDVDLTELTAVPETINVVYSLNSRCPEVYAVK